VQTYLSTTQLQVRRVNLSAQDLVQCGCTSQNDRLTFDLNSSLTQSQQVSSDTDGTSGNERDREDIIVRSRGGTSDETRTFQTLDTETIPKTNDVGDLMSPFSILFDLVSLDDPS
jgi:hypothetical protein